MQFVFENHVLDADKRELRRGSQLIALEPQVFDLLLYLIQNRDRVVSKDDLIHAIWNGRVVLDAALTTRLNAARVRSHGVWRCFSKSSFFSVRLDVVTGII